MSFGRARKSDDLEEGFEIKSEEKRFLLITTQGFKPVIHNISQEEYLFLTEFQQRQNLYQTYEKLEGKNPNLNFELDKLLLTCLEKQVFTQVKILYWREKGNRQF